MSASVKLRTRLSRRSFGKQITAAFFRRAATRGVDTPRSLLIGDNLEPALYGLLIETEKAVEELYFEGRGAIGLFGS